MASPITGPGSDSAGRILPDSRTRQSPQPGTNQAAGGERPVRTVQDAINILRTRLDQRLQQSLGSVEANESGLVSAQFEPPSAADVAARVLGFIQGRLQQEAQSGADQGRLAELLSQARAGVEQGFREAREQIEALGMMNDTLSSDIDDSFNRIQDGLGDLEERFLGQAPGQPTPVEATSLSQVEAMARDTLAFEVRTRDGDVVQLRMDESRYGGIRVASGGEGEQARTEATAGTLFAGRYSFSVEGELDAGEREALTALFGEVQNVAGRFFDGDVRGAFEAAQSLGLSGDELASFSLNLTASRTVRAATYEAVSGQPESSARQLRPLGGLAREIQDLGRQAQANGLDLPALDGLMSRILSDIRNALPASEQAADQELSQMDDFFRRVLERLQPETSGPPEP
ncbi:MAG: DUF5610 domain-containing protein [Marinobacter sp.]|uniref:DUF5610 domain-containing protein n=1 Tax=Marinobacter sp. TaxID=50741 RepID=UPI00299D7377|nr:DUF5610 domain-containing protein [Marinobacter sp.]MDX1756105.1 DUF5610 domain-containing protein [Marinobacter sp.]